MAITDDQKFLLNRMNSVAQKVQLGDLIEAAEEGGLANNAVSLEHLDSGIAPSHVVKYAGKATTAGGAAAEAITVTGVAATDVVIVTLQTEGATPRSIVKAVPSTNTITVTFSGDPSTDHIVAYQVLRAAS
jgi:hypothetical protein